MRWYTHIAFAALMFLVLKLPLNWPWLALPVCLVAAIIPDVDHPDSKINQKLGFTQIFAELIFSHRGIVHTLLAAVAFSTIAMAVCLSVGLSMAYTYVFFAGYLSHLMIDSLNPTGIAWLKPIYNGRAKSVIKTGGIGEILVLCAISGLIMLNLVKLLL